MFAAITRVGGHLVGFAERPVGTPVTDESALFETRADDANAPGFHVGRVPDLAPRACLIEMGSEESPYAVGVCLPTILEALGRGFDGLDVEWDMYLFVSLYTRCLCVFCSDRVSG